MNYRICTAYELFGRRATVQEVENRVPLVLLCGGPKDGWIYDAQHIREASADDEARDCDAITLYR